jgi:tetratricopeptide (TPR) repeat protein
VALKWKTSDRDEHGLIARFLPALRNALAQAPERTDVKVRLAKALLETGQAAEVVDMLKPLLGHRHAAPELLCWLGRAAIAMGDDSLALTALRSAAASGAGDAFYDLPAPLRRMGREDEALDAALEALKRNPNKPEPLQFVAATLCNRGEIERLWNLCLELRAGGAHGGWLPAAMASAAAMLGDMDAYGKLMDRSRWFLARRLDVPDGFNRDLAAEILADRHAQPMPKGRVTPGAGAIVDNLQRSDSPLVQEFFRRIHAAVEDYVAERETCSFDPAIAQRPAALALKSWSLAMHDDGHTGWHIHPRAWLSGVYYVAVPKLDHVGSEQPGTVEFGPFPLGGDTDALKALRWHLMPTPGLLLLFPSHYAHRSWPTGLDARRISIALDVGAAPHDGAGIEWEDQAEQHSGPPMEMV